MPLVPLAGAPDAAVATSSPDPLASATSMQVDADALFAEEAGEQEDADIMQLLSQEGSVGLQVQQLRSTLHAAMAAMFASTGAPSLLSRSVTPSHNIGAANGAAPSAPATAASLTVAAESSTVVSELNLPQLREMQSYLQSMLAATSRQIRRRERERSSNNSRHASAPIAGAPTPKRTSASSPPAGPRT
jgi:hypothetical protein